MSKQTFDLVTLYNFIRRLTTPFEDFEAYKMGLIDNKGQFLKKRRDMTRDEKNAVTYFDILIINLKKLLARIPGGNSRFGTFMAALFLLKEEKTESIEKFELLEDYEMFERTKLCETVTTSVSAALTGDPKTRPAIPFGIKRAKAGISVVDYLAMKNKKKRKDLNKV